LKVKLKQVSAKKNINHSILSKMKILIKNAQVVNEGKIAQQDVLINNKFIERIDASISDPSATIIDTSGKYLLPGLIDDQVHFREPGLTHKGNIYTESRAAVAGGTTSFMEMPNTNPQTLTQDLLEEKYQIGAKNALANYSFFMGASNDNLEEVLKTNKRNVCGVKVFMGSSTGNMLVDNEETLTNIFSKVDLLIATHCEDEPIIKANLAAFKEKYGDAMPTKHHPTIRSREACYKSSSMAVELAKKYDTRLHVLHISTKEELELFSNKIPLAQKRITAEACTHHLWFNDQDYDSKGNWIKWNPAVKSKSDADAILAAVLDGRIDVLATDHAPHTVEEKEQNYWNAPSGGPLVQHSLLALLDFYQQGKISLTQIADKTAHAVATCFQIEKRGFIKEGYYADLVLVDLNKKTKVEKNKLLYSCGWSPFDGYTFGSSIATTIVSGTIAYADGKIVSEKAGERLTFLR
jgi:dihydroorotase